MTRRWRRKQALLAREAILDEFYYPGSPESLTVYRRAPGPIARWWTRRKRAWAAAGFSRWIGW